MTDEMIDILDEKGNLTGEKKLKILTHKDGSWHQTSHVWIFNSKGEILLQKRAKNKSSYPGLWDISAAGHLSAGETPEKGALRELFEELGINADSTKLKRIEVRKIVQHEPKLNFFNNEFAHVYILKFDGSIKNIVLKDGEVECVKFIPLNEFESDIRNLKRSKNYVPHGQYYIDIVNAIKKELRRK